MRILAINTEKMKASDITLFICTMRDMIQPSAGNIPIMSKRLGLTKAAPLRFLLGWPVDDLSPAKKRYAESIYAHLFKVTLKEAESIWIDSSNWKLSNPNATKGCITRAKLDKDYIGTLQIPYSVWEEEIFFGSKCFGRSESNRLSKEDALRIYTALAIFGFQNPEIFFTGKKSKA